MNWLHHLCTCAVNMWAKRACHCSYVNVIHTQQKVKKKKKVNHKVKQMQKEKDEKMTSKK